jgi:hypothetical protein
VTPSNPSARSYDQRMKASVVRVLLYVVGMVGLLALFDAAAPIYIGHQHCEPLLRP